MRYGLDSNAPRRLCDISTELDLTPQRARVIHKRALRKLRSKAGEDPEQYDEDFVRSLTV